MSNLIENFMDKYTDIKLKKIEKERKQQKQEIIKKHGEEFYNQINQVAEEIAYDLTYKNKKK
jgi:hypothetical protein